MSWLVIILLVFVLAGCVLLHQLLGIQLEKNIRNIFYRLGITKKIIDKTTASRKHYNYYSRYTFGVDSMLCSIIHDLCISFYAGVNALNRISLTFSLMA